MSGACTPAPGPCYCLRVCCYQGVRYETSVLHILLVHCCYCTNQQLPVDCQQLERTGARSLHSDCLHAQYDNVGETWHVKLDVGGEIVTMSRVARIWEEDGSVTA
jgi:hypothetical protein